MNLHDYDKLSQGRAQGRKEGIALGRQEGIAQGLQTAVRILIEMGLSQDQIAKKTGLSLEQVTALKEKNRT